MNSGGPHPDPLPQTGEGASHTLSQRERGKTFPGLVVCAECDAVYSRRPLASHEIARCTRCGAMLGRGHRLGIDGQLALALAALIVFLIGTLSPLVTLDLRGRETVLTLPEAIASTWQTGEQSVALLALATALVFPLAVIVLRLWLLVPVALGLRPRGFVAAMLALGWVTRWSMTEVFLLGALIAIVRSAGLANVTAGIGLFSYAALALLLTAEQSTGLHALWRRASQRPA